MGLAGHDSAASRVWESADSGVNTIRLAAIMAIV